MIGVVAGTIAVLKQTLMLLKLVPNRVFQSEHYGDESDVNVTYRNCILVKSVDNNHRFCQPGDSGSLYLALENGYWRPMGIHRTSDAYQEAMLSHYLIVCRSSKTMVKYLTLRVLKFIVVMLKCECFS